MKFCILIFILLKTTFSFSQSLQRKDTIKMICREWKFKEVYSDNFDENIAKDFIESARLLFKLNMTGIMKDEEWKDDFKWSYNSSKKSVTFEMKDGKALFRIILLSSSMMKLEAIDPGTQIFSSGTLVPAK